MKNICKKLLLIVVSFSVCQICFSQDPVQPSAFDWLDEPTVKNPSVEGSPFSQGNWNFRHRNSIKYQGFTMEDVKDNELGVMLQAKYFVANGFGLGLSIGYDNETSKDDTYSNKTSGFDVSGGLTYGYSFGDFNLFVEGWAGIGKVTNTQSYSGGSETEQKTDQFKYKVALGSPIRLGDRSVYLTPRFGYSVLEETDPEFSDYKYTESGLFFDLKMDFYLGCEGMFCGYDDDGYDGRYDQGTNHLVVPSWGRLKIGDTKESYGGDGTYDLKDSYLNYRFSISDYQYIVDNLAIGLSGSIQGNTTEQDGSDYKITSSTYSIMPMLRFNVPSGGCFNNVFLEAGYGLGSQNNKTESGGTTSESKYDVNVLKAGLGYNYFVHYNFGFVLGVYYQDQTVKNDAGSESKSSGIYGTIGSTIRF